MLVYTRMPRLVFTFTSSTRVLDAVVSLGNCNCFAADLDLDEAPRSLGTLKTFFFPAGDFPLPRGDLVAWERPLRAGDFPGDECFVGYMRKLLQSIQYRNRARQGRLGEQWSLFLVL